MKAAYQGQPGAFGHEACLTFLPGFEPVAKPSFAEVIEAVETGEADRGILPVENSAAGPVPGMAALLDASPLAVLARHSLPVRMHLLGLPGSRIDALVSVASHPVALAQSAKALAALGVRTEEASNTAVAAMALRDGQDPTRAVLASEPAAAIYGLTILQRDVHDQPDNRTSFCVVARKSA